ncbi:MAG: lipopolysaccharide biosynthesis protein [Planctomycetes bacterium]|nr:lipopolysaccharide biosynthesis protein [Planctomycetota bacterium]
MCGLVPTERFSNAPSDHRTFRHALKWAYVATLGQRGIVLLVTFVLAAILGPEDFGTVAMAIAYIIFIEMFVAQGMGAAIIQRKDLSREHLDSVFWLVVAASIVLCGVSVLVSPWWAAVNHLPELGSVIAFLSLSVPIKGLSVVQEALLQRKMDFRNLALLRGAALIIGGAVGVTMAIRGFGVWALVGQQLVGSALATAVMWKVSDWRPRLFFSWRRARELFGFSGGMFASQLGVYTASQSDAILMGLFFGPVAVGLYRLATRLMEAVLDIGTRSIQTVALPHFCSLQDDAPRLRAAVLSCIRLSATITIPAMTLLALASDELMMLLGEKWAPAAGVLKIVVFMGMAKALTLFTGPLLLANGRAGTVAVLVWILAIATAGIIAAVGGLMKHAAVGDQVAAVALTRTGTFIVLHGVVSLLIISHLYQISMHQLVAVVVPAIVVSAAALLTAKLVTLLGFGANTNPVVALFCVMAPATLAAGGTLLIVDESVRTTICRIMRPDRSQRITSPDGAVSTQQD